VIGGQSFHIFYNGGDGNDVTLVKDTTPPVIGTSAATEMVTGFGTVNVKNCANATVPGTVMISVQASDNCGLTGTPVVGLTNGVNGELALFAGESPLGTFNYTWTVTTTTANGTWTATVTASDRVNSTISSFTLCVNTRQITGQVQLQNFRGTGTVPAHTRMVRFVATQVPMVGTPTVLKTWNLTLSNVTGDTFNYTLSDVPADTTHLSAKTAWNLRRRLPVPFDVNSQSVVNFSGGNQLPAGDMNGDNRVQTLDYGILSANWLTSNAVADLNGDGAVQTLDYGLLSLNWLTTGDPE
jgi:hypothetical protein